MAPLQGDITCGVLGKKQPRFQVFGRYGRRALCLATSRSPIAEGTVAGDELACARAGMAVGEQPRCAGLVPNILPGNNLSLFLFLFFLLLPLPFPPPLRSGGAS